MNKKLLIGIAVLIFVIIAIWQYKPTTNSNSTTDRKTTTRIVTENEGNKYIEYLSPQTLEVKNSKRVLFFYANWCPTCIPADKEFKDNENSLPEGVVVIRVNYNDSETDSNEKALAKKYGITYQHTYVQIDENGNEVTKWNGGGFSELLSNIK